MYLFHQPWNVGGREPKVNVSNSTDSILYFGICSAIMGFAIFIAVLHIAFIKKRNRKHTQIGKTKQLSTNKIQTSLEAEEYLVQIRPHVLNELVKPINLHKNKNK